MTEMELSASPLIPFLEKLTEAQMAAWIREALGGRASHFLPVGGHHPAADLASIPPALQVDVLSRFRASLIVLLASFSREPATWSEAEADQLLSLAEFQATSITPGHTPWDLSLTKTILPLVENAQLFAAVPRKIRMSCLALLSTADLCHCGANFWTNLGRRNDSYVKVAWRGLLRDDWKKACDWIALLPQSPEAQESLSYYAGYAAERVFQDKTGELRLILQNALRSAGDPVRSTIEEEAAAMGIFLSRKVEKTHSKSIAVSIPPNRVEEFIGPGVQKLRDIKASSGAEIGIEGDGIIVISASDPKKLEHANELVNRLFHDVVIGESYTGEILSVAQTFALMQVVPDKVGMIRFADLTEGYTRNVRSVFRKGQMITAKCIGMDGKGHAIMSRIAYLHDQKAGVTTTKAVKSRRRLSQESS